MIISLSIGLILELLFWFFIFRWYRRKNKPIGAIVVNEGEGKILYTLAFDDDPYLIKDRKKVVLKVVRATLEEDSS